MAIFTKLEEIEDELVTTGSEELAEGNKVKGACLIAGYYGMCFLKGAFIGCAITGAVCNILTKKGYKMVKPE